MFHINKVKISDKLVLPIIEGGKGVGVSNGITAGNFAKNGAVGTFSGVNGDAYDENGNIIPQIYEPKLTRREKFEKLVEYSIRGGIAQARIAHDIAAGNGRIHMNVLWESGGARRVIEGVLEKASELIHGVTCGAGLPYELAEMASKYKVFYYPIISSSRAFKILWKRSYNKFKEFLGGVVYEDPWLAGGHNGISNQENTEILEDPYERIVSIRNFLNEVDMNDLPIIIAGGVWNLSEWDRFINNPEVGNIAFQFGTRPLLTKESPISESWKNLLTRLKKEDVVSTRLSPTGFHSLAVKNKFLQDLIDREKRQIEYSRKIDEIFSVDYKLPNGIRSIFIKPSDLDKVNLWVKNGYSFPLKTPDNTVVFVTPTQANEIKQAQIDCKGCLSECRFSNWSERRENNTTGILPDPRSFCIQNTLQDVIHTGDVENNLVFSGKLAYRFSSDPLYKDGNIPSIKELIDAIIEGR